MGFMLLIIPLIVGIIFPPIQLLFHTFRVGAKNKPDGCLASLLVVADICTLVFIPLVGYSFFAESVSQGIPTAVVISWSVTVILVVFAYFYSTSLTKPGNVSTEILLMGAMAVGVILNALMGIVWKSEDLLIVVNGPIALLFILGIAKRNRQISLVLADSKGRNEFAETEVLDYIGVKGSHSRPIPAKSALDRFLLPALYQPILVRWILAGGIGLLIFLLSMLVPVLFGISVAEVFESYVYGGTNF
ncbi:hypothetical protein [Neolewinella antarctica]|uniref:Uncharacterized protein n=1 Tax=Neolewinella antarctica TaxID=442734 RepID=A0ABX0XCA6_9BACT|nr:hypothetical protein [Neolewinella antarctica]NJC26817.1 hypothetical protein [Neolewinella antarctica]